jgi:DNA-directed RNA polymerase specialized sigma24 family protein
MPEFALPASSSVSARVAMPGVSSDARLARRAARGDRRAFAEIFARHHQAIYRYCRSILRDDEDAADALQNTRRRRCAGWRERRARSR